MTDVAYVRSVIAPDLDDLKQVLDETELFPPEILEDMINPYLNDSECSDIWKTYEQSGRPVALLFCEQERITASTWNVLALAVLPSCQNQGIGKLLMSDIEQNLRDRNQSTLIVETSSLPQYERTRKFYDEIGYVREARIRDFYDIGDDKIVFWKSLTQ